MAIKRPVTGTDSPARLVVRFWEEGKEYFRVYHEEVSKELDFSLKLAHYRTGNENTTDTRRIKPRTADLFDLLRHKGAQVLKDELYVEVWPVGPWRERAMVASQPAPRPRTTPCQAPCS